MLEDRLADPAVVLIAAPCLGRILRNAPRLTVQALDRQDAISKFATIVKKQKQAEQPQVCITSTTVRKVGRNSNDFAARHHNRRL